MRKYQKAAVVVAMLGSVGFLGAGVSQAHGDDEAFKLENKQNQACSADESRVVGTEAASDIINNIGAAGITTTDASKHTSVSCNQLFTIGK
ncbi:hypothetical protein [Streptomyces sp. NPDC046197]|uniref:hypothetical protein n=1 Tax=Streptomyces sp. NPDC046197 TaxID=3154337 RepID=UPI0033FB79B6